LIGLALHAVTPIFPSWYFSLLHADGGMDGSWPDLERDHQIITSAFFGCNNYCLPSSFSELTIAEGEVVVQCLKSHTTCKLEFSISPVHNMTSCTFPIDRPTNETSSITWHWYINPTVTILNITTDKELVTD